MTKINRNGIIVLIFLLAFAGYFIWPTPYQSGTWREALGEPEFSKVDSNKPLRTQTRTIELAGRTFTIPLMYIDGQLSKGRAQDGVNLKYVLPDFISKLELTTKDNYDKAFHDGRFAHMLIEPASTRPSFDIMIKNQRSGIAKEEYSNPLNTLEHYKWYRKYNGNIIYSNDVYLEKDDQGLIVSFITCSAAQSVPSPGCTHKFINNGVMYDIYYNREKYLQSWESQRDRAIKFVNSFENSTAHGEKQ